MTCSTASRTFLRGTEWTTIREAGAGPTRYKAEFRLLPEPAVTPIPHRTGCGDDRKGRSHRIGPEGGQVDTRNRHQRTPGLAQGQAGRIACGSEDGGNPFVKSHGRHCGVVVQSAEKDCFWLDGTYRPVHGSFAEGRFQGAEHSRVGMRLGVRFRLLFLLAA